MVRDLLSSSTIELMTGDAFKAYWILLCRAWLENDRATLPNDEAKLAALARVPDYAWGEIRESVLSCFEVNDNGRLFNEKLLSLSEAQKKKSKAGSKGGSKTQAKRVAKAQASEIESDTELDKELDTKIDTIKEIADLLPQISPSFPRFKLTDVRKRAFTARMKDFKTLEDWSAYFTTINNTPFLFGDNDRGWAANIDWILKPKNMVKIVEGAYDRKKVNPVLTRDQMLKEVGPYNTTDNYDKLDENQYRRKA